ncbi:MAG: IS110 family transposase [Fischerella sp. CENA71]|nr:IS110 family transposase [Fischerella sp. CENA71]
MKLPPNQRANQSLAHSKASSQWEQINQNAAGIDLGGGEHWVCVPADRTEKTQKKSTANHPDFNLRKYLYRMAGVDFTLIDGLDALTVQTILSEVGLDPKRFLTVKHFTSWLGLCPGQKITLR